MTSNMTSSFSDHVVSGMSFIRSRKCVFIILCCFLGIFQLVYHFTSTQFRYTLSLDSYTLPCEMPQLDPFDKMQMKNVKKSAPIKCPESHNPVFVDDKNIVQWNQTVLEYLKLYSSKKKCICQEIIRANDSDNEVTLSSDFTCTPPYNMTCDFFKIKCLTGDNKVIVDTILTNVFRTSWNFRSIKDDYYNVILFGIDSVSRNDAYRQIPLTVNYLKELGAIELSLHNRIGGHSFDNILPLITGHFADNVDIPYYDKVGERFQKFPFIWKNMSDNHYATFYAEDVLGFNTFNFQKEGFSTQPTTHYMRPFWLTDYNLRPNTLFWKESTTSYNKRRCLVNKPKYLVQIEYLKQFIQVYHDVRKFAMSHINDLAHQDVNELYQAEDHLIDFFKWLKTSGNLENTFLIVYSDHGPRGQSSTHQSTLETNLPFICLVPPKNLTKKYPELITNLKRNAQLLTTHFDLYATLRDIVLRNYGTPSVFYVNNGPRGISLFRNIGRQRSCEEANIPEGFCSCYRSKLLNSTEDPLVKSLANSVIDKLNQLVSTSNNCSVLSLKTIVETRVLIQGRQTEETYSGLFHSNSDIMYENDYSDYKIVIETVPGNGRFFATSKMDANGGRYILDNIERLNRYSNQSHCVTDDLLRPLCYCKDLLKISDSTS